MTAQSTIAPLALTDIRGLSSLEAGVTIAFLSISWSGGTFVQGRFPRVPTATVARVGVVCLVIGLPIVALSAVPAVPLPLTWIGWLATGLGAGLTSQGTSLHLMAHAVAGGEGRATAAGLLASVSGNGIGTWLGGVLLTAALGAGVALEGALTVVFAACTGAAVLGLLSTLRMTRTPAAGHHARARTEGG